MGGKNVSMTPYELLGIAPTADDKTIRSAYLELIKAYPPDREPERFKEIANAYESIKDAKKRLEFYLFDKEIPITRPIDVLLLQMQRIEKRKPPTFDKLKELLRNA